MKKRLIPLIITLILVFSLASCGGNGDCTSHVDADKDAKCDVCGVAVECASCVDENKDAKCDVCGKDVACTPCVDEDKNAKCDVCGKDVACAPCIDEDRDGKCDVCTKDMPEAEINDIILIDEEVANFQFVLAKGIPTEVRKAVEQTIVKGTERKSGVILTSVTEGFSDDQEMEIEVLVGDVRNRGVMYTMDRYELGKEGYVIKIVGSKIIINAGSDEALADAVIEFAENILDYENKNLAYAEMTKDNIVEKYQSNYKITSLSIDGADMKGYTIATDLASERYKEAGLTLQDAIYDRTGYWFKLISIDEATEKSIIIKNVPRVYTDESFKASVVGTQLIIECAFDNRLTDTVASFVLTKITTATGDVNFAGTVFNRDISYVTYEDFGAVGNGKADDFKALYEAHVFANESGQTVMATPGKTYYLHTSNFIADGSKYAAVHSIPVMTNTVWEGAAIVIDDSDIDYFDSIGKKMATSHFVEVKSDYERFNITDPEILEKVGSIGYSYGTTKIEGLDLGYPALLAIYNSKHKVYRRSGGSHMNESTGVQQSNDMHELILIDAEGNIDPSTPFMFDYDQVTKIYVMRADDAPITIKGGTVTTIACGLDCLIVDANGKERQFSYYQRGIDVSRSNTVVEGVKHFVIGEITFEEHDLYGKEGVHYRGFFYGSDANDVTFRNCQVQGRRYYGVSGTYDLGGNMVNKITFEGCTQINFWIDANGNPATAETGELSMRWNNYTTKSGKVRHCWGVGGTNFCKNMSYINSQLSRFDAHCGLYNGKVIGCEITFFAITGKGDFIVEDTKWYSAGEGKTDNSLIYMRGDYGSTWEGNVVLKNVDAYVSAGEFYMFFHSYNNWDYGYKCHIPNIEIDTLNLFNIKTKAPIDELEIEFFSGTKDDYMHLATTKKTPPKGNILNPETGKYETITIAGGQWIFDHESNSYVEVPPEEQVKNRNDNPIGMPDYIKFLNITKDYTFIFTFSEDESFYLADTKFYYGTGENDYYLGTNHNSVVKILEFK